MVTVEYTVNLDDPKSMIAMVRDDLMRLLSSPGATNISQGQKKIRFYNWCLERADGAEKFETYCKAKRKAGLNDEAGFLAAGWKG